MFPRSRTGALRLACALWCFQRACAAVAGEALTDEYIVDVWDIQDGLPHSTVTGIVQTPDGYLWCSTHDGVARFDGVRFVRIGPDDRANRRANHVLYLHADRRGQLWLGTDGAGLIRYANGTFTAFAEAPGSPANTVCTVIEDAAGALWMGTLGGLGRWSEGQVEWRTEAVGFTNAPARAWGLALDRERRLWVADGRHLKILNRGGFATAFGRPDIGPQLLRTLYCDRAGTIWTGALEFHVWRGDEGQWQSVGECGELQAPPLPQILSFHETGSGDFWVGTRNGLFRRRAGQWQALGNDDGRLKGGVRAILEDREGNLWVGTDAGGLARIKRRIVTAYTARDGLTDEGVQALCASAQGGLWVGLNRGGVFQGAAGIFSRDDELKDLPADAPVTSILRARNGDVWIGTFGNGLRRFRGRNSIEFDYAPPSRAPVDKITALLEDRSGKLWVGSYFGLLTPTNRNRLVPVLIEGRLLRSHVTALLEDPAGGLWVGFHGLGLAHLSGEDTAWVTRHEGLPTDFVRTLHQEREGTLWIGTAAGLCRWRKGTVSTFTKAHGLVDDTISQILEDESGNLWLGSNHGIMRVAKREFEAVAGGRKGSLEVFVCGRGEGMPSLECAGGFYPAGLKSNDGQLWFPTAKGLVMVDPSQLELAANPALPRVYIEEVWANGELAWSAPLVRIPGEAAAHAAPLRFPHGTRRVEIKYTALSLTAPERVRFRHRLEGFDPDWAEGGAARATVYPRLAPGHYEFQVIACNNDGLWNESGARIAFRIPPHFWQTGWFLGLATVMGLTVAAGTARHYEKRKLQQRLERLEWEQAVERERARIARDIHDDLGASLTRIALLSQSACAGDLHNGAASDLDQIYDTARDLTRAMDEIVWAVSPRHDTLDSLATYLGKFAQDFLRAAGIRCRLDMPVQLPAWPLPSEVRHSLFLAFKEALHNAVKHAAASEVRIHLAVAGDSRSFTLSINDNGKGFQPAAGPPSSGGEAAARGRIVTGHGRENMRKRLAEIGGRCELKSQPGGTSIIFVVPNQAAGPGACHEK